MVDQTADVASGGDLLQEALRVSPIFGAMPAEQRLHIAKSMTVITVPGDAYILEQGTKYDVVYLVLSGRLEAVVETDESRCTLFSEITQGGVIGEYSALDGLPSSADVIAVSPCALAAFSHSDYRSWLREFPALSYSQHEHSARRVRELTNRVTELSVRSGGERLRKALLAHLKLVAPNSYRIVIPHTQKALAQRLGLRREAVNRYLRRWEEKGYIQRNRGGFDVLNLKDFESGPP